MDFSELYYSRKQKDTWSSPQRIHINRGLHVTPVIAADNDHRLWFVWIEQTKTENILRFLFIDGEKRETGRVMSGEKEQSYAPSILIDKENTPWIAWSGIRETLADIYAAHWNKGKWSPAQTVNKANSVPDITPLLGMTEEGKIWVTWNGAREDSTYAHYTAYYTAGKWLVSEKTFPTQEFRDFARQRLPEGLSFPEQAGRRLMGALFTQSTKQVQSITDFFLYQLKH
ncbi:MAG: hypothetical protein CSA20_00920 [Deltaproteobacteria bacterium]|nr:MAG: hypothetical protein CSA20_00920 [Deltaproteobacteria bacterium]